VKLMGQGIKKILLLEDNPAEASAIKKMLLPEAKGQEFSVQNVQYLADALKLLEDTTFDCILADLGLPDSEGLDTALALRARDQKAAIVVFTALDDEAVALKSLEMDVQDYLVKGEITAPLLVRAIRYAMQRKRMSEELEDANRELQTFNYSIAHDLRQPLNIISGYCQALKMLCGDRLDEVSAGYLQGTYEGTLRMSNLIEALLNFSHLSRVELQREMVDLSKTARELAEGLRVTNPERPVTFQIADGVTVDGDPNLLRAALDNLIGNAWKYTAIREEAVIEFGSAEIDGKTACFIRDNGPGFDMADAEKLFLPFKRLSGAEEPRGFGIGLATVERIIKRHGGSIWAEGEPDKGATFWFTLPTRENG